MLTITQEQFLYSDITSGVFQVFLLFYLQDFYELSWCDIASKISDSLKPIFVKG
jgi:hypothetical protein